MTEEIPLIRQAALGRRLRELRERYGVSQSEVGQRLGVGQMTISRIEQGKRLPTQGEVESWVAAVRGTNEDLDTIIKDLRHAEGEYLPWDFIFTPGPQVVQKEIGQSITQFNRQRDFQPVIIPGIFQLPAYIEAIFRNLMLGSFSEQEVAESVQERVAWQAQLFDKTKSFESVISESVLRFPLASPSVMAMQMDRLIQLSTYPTVKLGILLEGTPLSYLPYSSWCIRDDLLVEIELLGGVVSHTNQKDIARYVTLFDHFMEKSLQGDEAREFLYKVAREYASQPEPPPFNRPSTKATMKSSGGSVE